MGELSRKLDRFGDMLAEASDRQVRDGMLASARRRFLARGAARPRRAGHKLAWAGALAVVVACLAVVVGWRLGLRSEMAFVVGTPPVVGTVGEWVAADGQQPLPVRFEDGSVLALEPGGRLRVSESAPDGAMVLVERGTVHALIEHKGPATRWQVHAGPYSVRVTGTRFHASWEPQSETFELRVDEGAVAVSGPLLPPERPVVTGERLVVSVREQRMDLTRPSVAALPAPAADAAAPAGSASASCEPVASAAPSCAPTSSAPAAPSASGAATVAPRWRELLATRKYQEAWSEIEQRGFEQQMVGASAADLLALADAARFAGQPERAKQALLALRQRHGARGHSAFLLGRICADQLGSPAQAVRWFETYLQEEPTGSLAEQALGRILDIQRHGSPEAARVAAERYLARFPTGAYAALARSVLNP